MNSEREKADILFDYGLPLQFCCHLIQFYTLLFLRVATLSRRCLCCLIALRGTFTTKQQWCVRTALCAMAKLGWRQFWHALQKWLLSSHHWPNVCDQLSHPHERKWICYHVLKSVLLYLFSILRNFESNRGYLLRNSIELMLKTWKNELRHVLQKILSSHLLSNMRDQCIIWKKNIYTIIPCY